MKAEHAIKLNRKPVAQLGSEIATAPPPPPRQFHVISIYWKDNALHSPQASNPRRVILKMIIGAGVRLPTPDTTNGARSGLCMDCWLPRTRG